MRRRILAASLLVAPLVAVAPLAGCSGGSSTSSTTPATSVTPARTATAAAPAPSATAGASTTTIRAATTTAARTGTETTLGTIVNGPVTTNVPAAPCDATTLLAAAQLAFGPLPEGATATDPRCVENYATAVLTAPGQDNALAVFDNPEGEWIGRNLGTDQVCSSAGVPIDFFGPLGCGPWEG